MIKREILHLVLRAALCTYRPSTSIRELKKLHTLFLRTVIGSQYWTKRQSSRSLPASTLTQPFPLRYPLREWHICDNQWIYKDIIIPQSLQFTCGFILGGAHSIGFDRCIRSSVHHYSIHSAHPLSQRGSSFESKMSVWLGGTSPLALGLMETGLDIWDHEVGSALSILSLPCAQVCTQWPVSLILNSLPIS